MAMHAEAERDGIAFSTSQRDIVDAGWDHSPPSFREVVAAGAVLRQRGNPRKIKGKSTTLRNMASVTITKLPNGVVKITGRKMRGKR